MKNTFSAISDIMLTTQHRLGKHTPEINIVFLHNLFCNEDTCLLSCHILGIDIYVFIGAFIKAARLANLPSGHECFDNELIHIKICKIATSRTVSHLLFHQLSHFHSRPSGNTLSFPSDRLIF